MSLSSRKLHPLDRSLHTKREIRKPYSRMQKIDRNLRGKGFPDQISPRDVSREINKMQIKLDEYRDSTLAVSNIKNKQATCGTLTDAVEFKPGIFGFSFDLKKFWKWCMPKLGFAKNQSQIYENKK